MPHRQLPNSVPTVLRLLTAARDQWKDTANPADRAIAAEQWAQLDDANGQSLLNRLITEAGAVNLDLAAQGPATNDLETAAAKLTMFVSHFHRTFDLAVLRGTFAPAAREFYGRPIHATTIPDLSTYDAAREAAENIVKGEAARAAAEGPGQPLTMDSGLRMGTGLKMDTLAGGYVAMALPGAAEVGAALDGFNQVLSASGQAKFATSQQRKVSRGLYDEAHALAVDICDTVEFFYRKDTNDATRRADCRRWGVVYVGDQHGAAPAPTPAPQPPA